MTTVPAALPHMFGSWHTTRQPGRGTSRRRASNSVSPAGLPLLSGAWPGSTSPARTNDPALRRLAESFQILSRRQHPDGVHCR
jgi:hypothetical protein